MIQLICAAICFFIGTWAHHRSKTMAVGKVHFGRDFGRKIVLGIYGDILYIFSVSFFIGWIVGWLGTIVALALGAVWFRFGLLLRSSRKDSAE